MQNNIKFLLREYVIAYWIQQIWVLYQIEPDKCGFP